MPGFDRTGPMGAGPMTGGRRGLCNPAAGNTTVYAGYGYGRGLGLRCGFRGGYGAGRGGGRGYGWYPPAAGFYPPYPMGAGGELEMLREQAGSLKKTLDAIQRRIEAMEKQQPEAEQG